MAAFIILGCVAFIFGVILIISPKILKSSASYVDKIFIDMDKFILKNRIGVGVSCMLLGACLWFLAYYMWAIVVLRTLY